MEQTEDVLISSAPDEGSKLYKLGKEIMEDAKKYSVFSESLTLDESLFEE